MKEGGEEAQEHRNGHGCEREKNGGQRSGKARYAGRRDLRNETKPGAETSTTKWGSSEDNVTRRQGRGKKKWKKGKAREAQAAEGTKAERERESRHGAVRPRSKKGRKTNEQHAQPINTKAKDNERPRQQKNRAVVERQEGMDKDQTQQAMRERTKETAIKGACKRDGQKKEANSERDKAKRGKARQKPLRVKRERPKRQQTAAERTTEAREPRTGMTARSVGGKGENNRGST